MPNPFEEYKQPLSPEQAKRLGLTRLEGMEALVRPDGIWVRFASSSTAKVWNQAKQRGEDP